MSNRLDIRIRVNMASSSYESVLNCYNSPEPKRNEGVGEFIDEIEKIAEGTEYVNHYFIHEEEKIFIGKSTKTTRKNDNASMPHLLESSVVSFDNEKGKLTLKYYPKYTFR